MKNYYPLFFFLVILSINSYGQTYVSGGIYADTTWTEANSPYIVTDTMVVFPGVTLTIEPGVRILFDSNIRLEIRNGSIVADGTSANPIIFTYASSAIPGIWDGIYLNHSTTNVEFNYCQFSYANNAIYTLYPGNLPSLQVHNSIFSYNNTGILVFDFTLKKGLIDS